MWWGACGLSENSGVCCTTTKGMVSVNKEVCKVCINRRTSDWSTQDESLWNKNGFVVCPLNGSNRPNDRMAFIKKGPPQWCSFPLEHFILNQSVPSQPSKVKTDSMDEQKT